MKFIVRESAYRDLDEIHAWITKDDLAAADRVIERIIQSTELLGHFPHIGHRGRAAGTQEWVVPGSPYIVVYTIDQRAEEVVVIAVFHGAQSR